jgi:hypothetical protein
MIQILIHKYTRLKPGRKTSKIDVKRYHRDKRKRSGKIRKEGEVKRLGLLRDPETGWLMGTYKMPSRRRAKSIRK